MGEAAVLWHDEAGRNFLADLRAFCRSLDWYELSLDLTTDAGVEVRLLSDGYRIGQSSEGVAFACPKCGAHLFDVAEGAVGGTAILGLACRACESYGVLAPQGL